MSKAKELIDKLVENYMTKGINNAHARSRNCKVCVNCGSHLPVYPGRYPSHCFICGEPYEVEEVQ